MKIERKEPETVARDVIITLTYREAMNLREVLANNFHPHGTGITHQLFDELTRISK